MRIGSVRIESGQVKSVFLLTLNPMWFEFQFGSLQVWLFLGWVLVRVTLNFITIGLGFLSNCYLAVFK